MTSKALNIRKIVSISSKRQLTIPLAFFKALGFENEAECIFNENELIIRPASIDTSGYFSEEILKELIDKGYAGNKLLEEFKIRQAKIKPAVTRMLKEAGDAANNKTEYKTIEEVFDKNNRNK